ncbi:MAG: SDR family NAD(P)-dependent oxidoreductase [Gammaproteobacteria bacterium]
MKLRDRKAVVTGASTGIGRAVAIALAKEGATVAVNYRSSAQAADECVALIEANGGSAASFQADVSKPVDIARLVEDAEQYLAGIDIWANVAGADILTGAGASLSDSDKLQHLLAVDLTGTMECCWAAEPVMRRSNNACIVNMSWDLALRGMEGRNPEMFAAAKAGVTGFTRSFARSVAPAIRVNEVAPGWIATAFAETRMTAQYRDWVVDQTPLGRFGTPDDIANAVVFLCAEESSFITGQTLNVNGGLSS